MTVSASSPVSEASEIMRDKGFDQLPVLSATGNKLVGLVTLGNLLSYVSSGRASASSPVSDVMFDFGRLDEVVTDPREIVGGEAKEKGKKRKFVEITLDTPLSTLSKFLEWNSAAGERGQQGAVEARGGRHQGRPAHLGCEQEGVDVILFPFMMMKWV
uniref:Cystathionine beta-synthase n=1 Tax=Colletotrichum fructicola (strain Nara gc5) TaxID=1213859 RepID=L2GBD7_COLFN